MWKKISIFLITHLMITTSIVFIPSENIVKADGSPQGGDYNVLDNDYVKNITFDLSRVIYDNSIQWKYDIPKGRAFGTEGERYAAEYIIKYEMNKTGLWNVTLDQLKNISGKSGGNLTHKLEIKSLGLSINHSGEVTDVSEFYIAPRWNYTTFLREDVNKTKRDSLSHNFSYEDQELLVKRRPQFPCFDYVVGKYVGSLIDGLSDLEIAENFILNNLTALMEFLMDKFEEEYNFSWDNSTGVGPDNTSLPWYNESLTCVNQPYVLIDEDPTFNPDRYKPEFFQTLKKINPLNLLSVFYNQFRYFFQLKIRYFISKNLDDDNLKGLILYDHNNDTYNMNNWRPAVPVIFMNRTIGKDMYDDTAGYPWISDDYTVKFHINQNFNETVESYNVMGQINGTNSSKKTVILCSYLDAWWNQGVVDGAIPMSMVLAIAKYMRELNETYGIEPKFNVKFIGFAGEEHGCNGASYYVKNYTKKNIKTMIDLNQLGFFQDDPPHPLTLCIGADNRLLAPLIKSIVDKSHYPERLNDGTDTMVRYMPLGIPANVMSFANKGLKGLPPHTIGFLKDTNWTRHHRDGLEHGEGDTMQYWYDKDVNLSGELIWNTTKYFTIDPDCWFTNTPTFDFWDSNDQNDYNDTVNVSFSLDTIMPREGATVRLLIHPNLTEQPALSLLYRHRVCKQFDVTPDGINGYINTTLPKHFPKGKYDVMLYLCNTSGEANIGWFDCLYWNTTGKEVLDFCKVILGYDLLGSEFSPIRNMILKLSNLNIIDFLTRLTDIRPVRDLLKDLFGYYCWSEDNLKNTIFMAPPNDPPVKPETPIDIGKLLGVDRYKTRTTDPDAGAKIRYQWEWNGTKGFPTIRPYKSGEYHKETHLWLNEGLKTIRVRAKNYRNPNYYSPWSNYLNVSISPFCFYEILSSQSSQNNINNPYIINSFDPNVVVVDENVSFQGDSFGFAGPPNYTFEIQGESTNRSGQQDITLSFDESGTSYVNFSASYNGTKAFCNTTMNVVNLSACFNMSQLGAQPNTTIYFNDTTINKYTLNNWTWDFDDGTISYGQYTNHSFNATGAYNVTLNVTDSNNEVSTFWQIVNIENNPPEIISTQYLPVYGGTLGCNMTLCAEFFDDNESGIESASVNISYPNGTTNNFTMYENENNSFGYEYVFNDTMQVGWYYYTIWVTDFAKNTNSFAGCGFEILPAFGCSTIGNSSKNIVNNISGSNFTVFVNGTAESISAYIQTNLTTAPKTKCMIYRVNDSKLIGTTEEKTVNTGDEPDWVAYNFTGEKPPLATNTSYVIACWSNKTCNLYYDNAADDSHGRYNVTTYGSPPQKINWTNESRLYSIYCTYSTVPGVKSASASPDPFGLGINTTITADVEHYYTLVENITVNITYPNSAYLNSSMEKVDDDTFQYTFDDAWTVGQYDYLIWVKDKLGGTGTSSEYSFNVSSQATISVCTIKDEYGNNEIINLTDPPGESPLIGYELLDNADVLHVWNKHDSYYFDTDSGIQLTNHYDEYWSHNVLMLGYYNNEQWNLIYRTDELSGFSKNIDTDNETFVNATIWKDLTYQGYDFRLAIRYHLGVNDNELTVIPYIKNLDEDDIPYTLGFGWEMNDIQIDMTETGDYINVNQTMYHLNQTLDISYTNLSESEFYLMENITDSGTKSLYLKWNNSLTYKLQVKSQEGQYNAPVTLFMNIGTLDSGQEKYTKMYWYDADQETYYFDSFSGYESWASNPHYMTDGSISNYASTTIDGDIELCDGNNCSGSDIGDISAVEIRVCAYYSGGQRDILLRPVFGGTTDGQDIRYTPPYLYENVWSPWYDITGDPYAPVTWSWSDVANLDCDVEVENDPFGPTFTMYSSKVEVRVTHDQYDPPGISNPVPSDGSDDVSLIPTLNITVNDEDNDVMNITWLSNSSGSWQEFGVNSSVYDGTYHQVFSNATENGKWWYWKVNVSDENNFIESDVFRFYTGCQSKINNTGSCNFKGYLLIQVQYYNETSEKWVVADDTINETTPRTMLWANPTGNEKQNVFALDTIFNGLVNTSNLSSFGNGTYRIYAAFRDPDDDVLVCNDETELETTHEFSITFD